jgi:hypothetical protein
MELGYICTLDITHDQVEKPPSPPIPYVHMAAASLAAAVDPSTVGAAVTVELCGRWQHRGVCRWPHNNDVRGQEPTQFRVLFVADERDEFEVRRRIEKALRSARGWSVLSSGPRPVRPSERALAARLSHALQWGD